MSNTLLARRMRPAGGGIRSRMHKYPFAIGLTLAVILLIANLSVQGDFGLTQQLAAFAPFALIAMASAPAILSGRGGIDISVGPLMTLVNIVVVAYLMPAGLSEPWVMVPIAVAVGALIGGINGFLIAVLRFQPIVATLCMYFVLGGLNLKLAPVPVRADASWLSQIGNSFGVVPGGLAIILMPLIIWGLLSLTPFRRTMFAVGGNDAVAFSNGVNVTFVRIASYMLGGIFAAFGGLALAGLMSSANASTSNVYTLAAIAAVALGGTSFLGGRGGLFGCICGAACIYLIQALLQALNVSSTWVQIAYGLLLLFAVVINGDLFNRRKGTL